MSMIYNWNPEPEEPMVPFRQLILDNCADIKSYMRWDNYDLNDTVIPVVEIVKDHALIVLMNSYGRFHVKQSIVEELMADVFIYFPILLQQLSITRLIDAYGVVKDDIESQQTVRTETVNSNVEQNSELTQGTVQTDDNVSTSEQNTSGTVATDGHATNTQNSDTTIENRSGVQSTGSRSVSLDHNMPEQSIVGGTGFFPIDPQGTPMLQATYAQVASQGFTTSNPINTDETSEQNIMGINTTNNDSTTTNDSTVNESGNATRTITNSGSDKAESTTGTNSTNNFDETVTSTLTNKQYAYEIKAFLETADGLVAFKRWDDNFSWVVGII